MVVDKFGDYSWIEGVGRVDGSISVVGFVYMGYEDRDVDINWCKEGCMMFFDGEEVDC